MRRSAGRIVGDHSISRPRRCTIENGMMLVMPALQIPAQNWHDSGAVAARYRHAFGGLSARPLVGQSVRNPADSAEFLTH